MEFAFRMYQKCHKRWYSSTCIGKYLNPRCNRCDTMLNLTCNERTVHDKISPKWNVLCSSNVNKYSRIFNDLFCFHCSMQSSAHCLKLFKVSHLNFSISAFSTNFKNAMVEKEDRQRWGGLRVLEITSLCPYLVLAIRRLRLLLASLVCRALVAGNRQQPDFFVP